MNRCSGNSANLYFHSVVLFCVAGMIDILQQYNIRKTAESMMRAVVNKRSEVSAVDPDFYAERFQKFMADHSE